MVINLTIVSVGSFLLSGKYFCIMIFLEHRHLCTYIFIHWSCYQLDI